MAKALPAFLTRRPAGPSDYTIARDQQKDAESEAREARIKKHEQETEQIAKDMRDLAIARFKEQQDEHDLSHIKQMNEQAAKDLAVEMAKINAAKEGLFLKELHALDPEDFASHQKRLALMDKYHGIPKLSDFGKQALKDWDDVMNITVHDELVKRKAAEEKKAAAEEKRVNAQADKHLKDFDTAREELARNMREYEALQASDSPPATALARVQGAIRFNQDKAVTAGDRLKALKPEYAQDADDTRAAIHSFNTTQRDAASANLQELNDSGQHKVDSSELKAARAAVNAFAGPLGDPQIIDVGTGRMVPNPSYRKPASVVQPPSESVVPPKPAPPVPASNPTPAPSETAPVSTPAPITRPAAPAPKPSPTGTGIDPAEDAAWEDVRKKRDAAIAERNKNLDILINDNGLNPFSYPKFSDASEAAHDSGVEANKLGDKYSDYLTRRGKTQHDRLVKNLGGQEAYDAAVSAHRAANPPAEDVSPAILTSTPTPAPGADISPVTMKERQVPLVPVSESAPAAAPISKEEYDALPEGAEFIHNGVRGVKPKATLAAEPTE